MKTAERYYPTNHAIERVVLRFGITADKALKWVNDKLLSAKYVTAQSDGSTIVFENGDARFVVNGKNNTVVTVHHSTRLDFLRPTLEREIRKIRREYTRELRHMERSLAGQYRKLGEQMANYANARNPNTRALIGERIEMTESAIEGMKRKIERIKDEMETRIRAIEVISE